MAELIEPPKFTVKVEDDPHLTIKVQKNGLPDYLFKIKHTTPLRRVKVLYCARLGFGDYNLIRFTVDGKRIRGNQTAAELKLEDGDVIDAWTEQLGGAAPII